MSEETTQLMCPRCYERNKAWSMYAKCPFCGAIGESPEKVVGSDWMTLFRRVTSAPEACPHFETCSVNRCPLSADYWKKYTAGPFKGQWILNECPDDRERGQDCRAWRETRRKIAEAWNLPHKGLSAREIRRDERRRLAKARYDALPDEKKREMAARLKRAP